MSQSNMTAKRAYRHGHCDGLLGKPEVNPFMSDTHTAFYWAYIDGWRYGHAQRILHDITLTLPERRSL